MTRGRFTTPILIVMALAAVAPGAIAQQPARRWERPGFDFRSDGVWRVQARRVRELRLAALDRGDVRALNAPVGAARAGAPGAATAASALAVQGVLRVPVILARFRNSPDTTQLFPRTLYDQTILGSAPPPGRPYTLRTFYEEISNGLLSIQGQVLGWLPLDSNDTWYEGTRNGDVTGSGGGHVQQLMREALQRVDDTVDFSQFDSNHDGIVDLAVFIHPEVGGECGNSNIWSHRFYFSGWGGGPFVTNDLRRDANDNPIPGQFVVVEDYTIQGGLGGSTACNSSQIMPIGTVAHETGHGFGLPDLYDTNSGDLDDSEGIGDWGLMSAGNYTSPFSPSYMEGFSRLQLGWVAVRDAALSGTYQLGPYASADTILRITPPPGVSNPRGEYFLIENRQAALSDSALIRIMGQVSGLPDPSLAGGLLVYHVDMQKYNESLAGNQVNSGAIHALWLLQADGLNQLRSSTPAVRNRGDAGDPYPGTVGNTALSFQSNPSTSLNTGVSPGFGLDSIRQLAPRGAMAFRLRLEEQIALLNSTLRPGVMGASYSDTIRATGGIGTYAFAAAGGSSALPPGLTLSSAGVLSGVPSRDSSFVFSVRITSGSQVSDIPLQLVITAPQLSTASVLSQLLGGAALLTSDQLRYLDLLGNRNQRLDVGDVLAWVDHTGVVLHAAVMGRLLGGRR